MDHTQVMTIQAAVKDIVHARPLCEVLDALLFEADCPVCDNPNFYVGVVGPSCPEEGCVHYHKAAGKDWQMAVRESIRAPKDIKKAKRALEAMDAADVSMRTMAKSGIEPTYIFDHVKGYTIGDTKEAEDRLFRDLKKHVNVYRSIKQKIPSWAAERHLTNIHRRDSLLFNSYFAVDFTPVLNNPKVESWYKRARNLGIVTFAAEPSIKVSGSKVTYYVRTQMRLDRGTNKHLSENFYTTPSGHQLTEVMRESRENIISEYNKLKAPGMKVTKDVSVHGMGRRGGTSLSGTVLQRGDRVFSYNIPKPHKEVKGYIVLGSEYVVSSISHNGKSMLIQKGDVATVELIEVGMQKHVVVEVDAEAIWKVSP